VDESASASTRRSGEAHLSLASFVERLLGRPAARALGKRLWGPGEVALEPGLPRRIEACELARWVRADDTACDLVGVPEDGQRRACLLVPSGDAARWVDRVLGGDGHIGHAQALGEPEAGVLAYALGRALHDLFPGVQLCDVDQARAQALQARLGACVVWPFVLRTPLGSVDLRVLWSDELLAQCGLRAPLWVELSDEIAAAELAQLDVGDHLVSDAWALTVTTTGLVGNVEVRVLGCHERWSARLSGDSLLLGASLSTTAHDATRVRFVIAAQEISLEALARLSAGQPLTLHEAPSPRVRVVTEQGALAEGVLIVQRGELGVRIARRLR